MPFEVLTVIVAEPVFFAVIFPFLSTAAMPVFELLQVRLVFAFEGSTTALMVYTSPTPRVTLVGFILTAVGAALPSSLNLKPFLFA